MKQEKYQQPYGSDFGEAVDQLIRELRIRSRGQLWELAGLGTNRDQWYDRANGKALTREKDLDTLLRGLEEQDYRITANMRKKLEASIHVVRVPDRPDRVAQLRTALDTDRDDLLKRRLAEFVYGTRQQEIRDILGHIEQIKESGGYLVIRGQAGEGKTSLVAKLIATFFQQNEVAYHIIPFTPSRDHQVTLLRSLMATLALKYTYLPNDWLSIYHRDILVGIFVQMLKQLEEKGDREVIFIDGLDQIQPEGASNHRDLNFLPLVVPKGIVMVLSTRPDDTLQPLKLRSPLYPYSLPKLSRADTASIFAQYTENLGEQAIDQLYEAAHYNALYVHFIARELKQSTKFSTQEIIQRISNNPNQIYDFALDRLKQPKEAWKQVLRPLLGVLLAAQEPMSLDAITNILHIDKVEAKEGIQRLEALVEHDSRGRYYLYHLKFREYLREASHAEDAVIPIEEERLHHEQLALWCAGEDPDGGIVIWQKATIPLEQERHVYARRYYVLHLYNAHSPRMRRQLFAVLDKGVFGRAKIRDDPSAHSYALDLIVGEKAAAWEGYRLDEGLALLPSLWRYKLLRCSLNSRADQYPYVLFDLLLLLGREAEVLGLAELLTDNGRKVTVFIRIAQYFFQADRLVEMRRIFLKAFEIAIAEKLICRRVSILSELAQALAQVGEVERASEVCAQAERDASSIEKRYECAEALCQLAQTLAQVGEVERAKQVCAQAEQAAVASIEAHYDDVYILWDLAQALVQIGEVDRAEQVVHRIQEDYNHAYILGLLAQALAQAGKVEHAKRVCAQAERETNGIERGDLRANVLKILAQSLIQMGEVERAKQVCAQAVQEASGSKGGHMRAEAMCELTKILVRAGEVEQAEQVAFSIEKGHERESALCELAQFLVRGGEVERAKQICTQVEMEVGAIDRGNEQAAALSKLAQALARAGKTKLAERVAYSIEDRYEPAKALSELAQILAQIGEAERAEQVVHAIEGKNARLLALIELVRILAQKGEMERAKRICAQAVQESSGIEDNYERVHFLIELARVLARAGEVEQAKRVCAQVKAVADCIQDNHERVSIFIKLAQTLAQAGEVEQAEQVVYAIEGKNARLLALSKLAQTLAQVGEAERARQMCAQAEQVSNDITVGSVENLEAMNELAQALVQEGEVERAKQVFGGEKMPMLALSKLAQTLAQAGEMERARQICAQAEQEAYNIEDSYWRAMTFVELAQILAQVGEAERAKQICAQAEQETYNIGDGYEQAQVLIELAQTLTQVGEVECARQVCARVELVASNIEVLQHRASILIELASILLTLKAYGQLLHCVQGSWFQIGTREDALRLLPLMFGLISHGTEIGTQIVNSFNWVDNFLTKE